MQESKSSYDQRPIGTIKETINQGKWTTLIILFEAPPPNSLKLALIFMIEPNETRLWYFAVMFPALFR